MGFARQARAICELRAVLYRSGLSWAGFARVEGFHPETVRRVVERYWGTKRVPHGKITKAVLNRLVEYCSRVHEVSSSAEPDSEPTEQKIFTRTVSKYVPNRGKKSMSKEERNCHEP